MLPFYPSAIESFDLSGYDLVVSSSSAWAHAVICSADTVHVSYCGALETVIDGVTGCFWDGDPAELEAAVLEFDPMAVDPDACVASAHRFCADVFKEGLRREVARAIEAAREQHDRQDRSWELEHDQISRRPPPWGPGAGIRLRSRP